MNTIGPSSEDNEVSSPASSVIPKYWKRFGELRKASFWNNAPALGDRVRPITGITYRTVGNATSYGINTHGTSFLDRGTDIKMESKPSNDEIDAALHLAAERFGQPLLLTGTDKFKGAVLERALEQKIAIGNPEMQMLQSLLQKQRYPNSTPQPSRTQPSTTTVNPNPQQQRNIDPIEEPVANDTERSFAETVHALIGQEFPNAARATSALPELHRENEVQLYTVFATSAEQFALSFSDGSYMVLDRSKLTADTAPGDSVAVTTDASRNVALVRPFIDVVVRNAQPPDPEIALRADPQRTVPVPTAPLNGQTRELLVTELIAEGRIALAASGIASEKMREIPFEFPTRPITYTVLAANDVGVLMHRGFGIMMFAERSKIPLPLVASGDKLPFRVVDGRIQAVSPSTAAPKPARTVSV